MIGDFKEEMRNKNYKENKITINNDVRSYYILRTGRKESKSRTAVFYYTGSGCHDTSYMLYPLYKNLDLNADIISLAKKGVIKNSIGETCSREFADNDNTELQVEESNRLLNRIAEDKEYENIVLLGHSEGADIAWRVSSPRRYPCC